MAERGVADPAAHLIVVRGRPEPGTERAPATFLFKKTPFTEDEVRHVELASGARGFSLLYTPLTRPPNDFSRLAEALDPASVWASLPSDVSPPTDDAPFFFNTARLSRAGSLLLQAEEWRKTNLGTFVLAALVVITLVLILAFIVVPLVLARRRLRGTRVRPVPTLASFAALGAGFILVEVALVQKCILFLGHPVYALTVVLFALLLASGAGSALSARFPDAVLGSRLRAALLAVAALVVLAAIVLSPLFHALVHLPRAARVALTVVLLAPIGLALGAPMPTAIRLLSRTSPEIIPWAWGVNGAASVLGSVGAIAIALAAGFNATLLVAAGMYVAAFGLVRAMSREPRA
jgi:hypothetical protein